MSRLIIIFIFFQSVNLYSQKIEVSKIKKNYIGMVEGDTVYNNSSKPKILNDTILEWYYIRSSTLLAVYHSWYKSGQTFSEISYSLGLNQDSTNINKYYIDFKRDHKGFVKFCIFYYDKSHKNKRKVVFRYKNKNLGTYEIFEEIVDQINNSGLPLNSYLVRLDNKNPKIKIDKEWK
jgi:hypothetical protein